jgi:hypothetical protein
MKCRLVVAFAIVVLPVLTQAYRVQAARPANPPAAAVEDEYVRYDLMAPSTGSFRIAHDLSVVTAGATIYTDVIPARSGATDISVIDLMSGTPLVFKAANGRIDITLARPVPQGGQARIRILETLKDDVSYHSISDDVVFEHPSSSRRVAVVLPKNFELIRSDVPVQVIEEADGRIAASFMSLRPFAGAAGGMVNIRARVLKHPPVTVHAEAAAAAAPAPPAAAPRRRSGRWTRFASSNAPSRIGRSSTFSNSRTATHSRCITTTPRRGKASTSTSTSCAPAVRCRIHRR